MSHERIEGMAQQGKGMVQEGWGRLTDQPDVEARGQAEQMAGQTKQFFAGIKQSVGDALDKVRQDPTMKQAGTRRAALKLLAYIAAALVVLNAILHAPRRL